MFVFGIWKASKTFATQKVYNFFAKFNIMELKTILTKWASIPDLNQN